MKRLLLLPLVLLVACKPPTPAESMDAALSWVSTAGVSGDAWLRHTTPDKYTRQTLDLSGQTLLQIGRDLRESPPSAINNATIDTALTRSRSHIARMARLVVEKNAPDFRIQLDSLRQDQKLVKQLADSIEASSK